MKTIQTLLLLFTILQGYGQHQWIIHSADQRDSLVKPDEKYHLQNVQSNEILAYHSQKKGINLSWLKPQKTNTHILLKDKNNDGILDTQDSVAIYIEGGAYLKYGVREYSISMTWSQTPVYEWVIVAENSDLVTIVQTKKKYGLYNCAKQAFMIYAERDGIGVRLQWSDDW